jgi:DNA-binding transcriptional LysR family regulator
VAELESQLGVVLFDRTGRGQVPTETALRLADSARAMQGGADQLARSVAGLDRSAAGTVRITASQPVSCYVLPPLLAKMRLSLPDIQVDLVASNAVSNLLRREADIAVRMVQPEQATLVARRVGKVALKACAHQDYLRRHGMPRQPADLLEHHLIGGDRSEEIRKAFAARGFPVTREQFVFRTGDLIVVWQAVRAGLGIGFVSEHLMRTDPAVIPVLPKLNTAPLPVWLAAHKEVRSSQRIRVVFDFLADALPRAIQLRLGRALHSSRSVGIGRRTRFEVGDDSVHFPLAAHGERSIRLAVRAKDRLRAVALNQQDIVRIPTTTVDRPVHAR